jgi:hypothetical protein
MLVSSIRSDPDLVMAAQFPIFVPFCARLVTNFEKSAFMTLQSASEKLQLNSLEKTLTTEKLKEIKNN